MASIDKELEDLNETIRFKERAIQRLRGKISEEDILLIQDEIAKLRRKVAILEDIKINGRYIPKKPEFGDERYTSMPKKTAIDMLRVLYYEYFKKDPSISFISDMHAMFDDDTLPIYTDYYLVRGQIPFRLMLTTGYHDYKSDSKHSIGISFSKKNLNHPDADDYLAFLANLIKMYAGDDLNFICGNILSYIGKNDLDRCGLMGYYQEFFNLLCDNNWRNIIYVGPSMQVGVRPEEIEYVQKEYIVAHTKVIAEDLGITPDELVSQNEEFANRILALSRKKGD